MTDDKSLTSTVGIGRVAGSFWTETYLGAAQTASLFESVAELAKQFGEQRDTAIDATARESVRPYRRERWSVLDLKGSELNTVIGSLLHYGDTAVYGPQPDGLRYQYGVSKTTLYVYPAPSNIRSCTYVSSRINLTGKVWLVGVDVVLDTINSVFIFRENPMADASVIATTTAADTLATLWLCDAEFEHFDVYNQYGFVHGFPSRQDSKVQKPGVLAVAEAILTGTNVSDFSALLAAGTGMPRTTQTELITDVAADSTGNFLATDYAIYRIPNGSASAYAVGQTVPAGTFITDDVIIQQFSQGTVPGWFKALGLSPGIAAVGLGMGLMLFNADVPLIADHAQTPPRISFDVGGNAQSAKTFFDTIQHRFQTAGLSLWDLLEQEYGANPTTINPLEFFIKHWFRGSLLVVKLSGAALAGPDQAHLRFIAKLKPPHTLLVVLADLQPPKQPFRISSSVATTFLGTEPQLNALVMTIDRVTIRYVATNCE
jgi:hypothetical protein